MAVVQSPGSSQVSMVMVAGEPFTADKAEVWMSSALYHSPQNFVLMTLLALMGDGTHGSYLSWPVT